MDTTKNHEANDEPVNEDETEDRKLKIDVETRVPELWLQRLNVPDEIIDRSELRDGPVDVQIDKERNDDEVFTTMGRKLKFPARYKTD